MPDQRFIYRGPLSGFSLAVELTEDNPEPRVRDVVLFSGEEPRVDGQPTPLPSDNDYVQSLVAQGLLEPVPEPARAPSTRKGRQSDAPGKETD